MVSLWPSRVVDTRPSLGATGQVRALGSISVKVTGQGCVPASRPAAVVVNVTAVNPASAGYITVWPSGTAQQQPSNPNFQAGQHIQNLVVVPVGADGKIQPFSGSGGPVNLVADIAGYLVAG